MHGPYKMLSFTAGGEVVALYGAIALRVQKKERLKKSVHQHDFMYITRISRYSSQRRLRRDPNGRVSAGSCPDWNAQFGDLCKPAVLCECGSLAVSQHVISINALYSHAYAHKAFG
jgi:hypothetical protein